MKTLSPLSRIEAVFEVARLVYEQKLSPTEGSNRLRSNYGYNINSAKDFIADYRHLVRGEIFQRGMSAFDMEYFLKRISIDIGIEALQLALHSLWQHIAYYEGIRNVKLHKLRGIAAKFQALALVNISKEADELDFDNAVAKAIADGSEARLERLKLANRIPTKKPVVVLIYRRNADVVAEVLYRANGYCEQCNKEAPFMRLKDGKPYLEVHHVVRLANGGEDTVGNSLALCPNCHRKDHYGKANE